MLGKNLFIGAITATVLTLQIAVIPASAETLVIAGWGGPYESQLRKKFIPAFEAKYNAKVEWLGASSFQNYGRLKAERANPQIDVLLFDDTVLYTASKEDLVAPLDRTIVTNLADIQKDALLAGDLGVIFGYNATGLYYNTKIFKQRGLAPVTSWKDLFRPELCKRIVIRNITSGYGLYTLLMLAKINGGDENNVGVGFDQMKKLSPCILAFPTANGEAAQLTVREDVWVGMTGMSEIQALRDQGVPVEFVIPIEGTLALGETVAVVKGAPRARLAQQFVNELLSPQGQHDMAIALSWKPANMKVTVDAEIRSRLPLDPTQALNLINIDFGVVMKNRSEWTERFAKEVVAQ